MDEDGEVDLDPRIQIELEKLNTTTDEINKLEIECDEANTTFRILLNESTRRLKLLSKKLGSCIEKARPYYELLELYKKAQAECQEAAVLYQRAHGVHAAAKETVALAEQRFLTNQHEWQFDNAWQEMLNHATMKVMEAETQKAEREREHQLKATVFKEIDDKLKNLEDKCSKFIIKSRPYFDEKVLCQEQLNTQKERIESIKKEIASTKNYYSDTLKNLERISNEIHMKRQKKESELLKGPREPGVGAELEPTFAEMPAKNHFVSLPDIASELDKCELHSIGSVSQTASSAVSERDEQEDDNARDLEEFVERMQGLSARAKGEGESKPETFHETIV
ncbi:SH3 domain-binding protein 5 homolog isoform X2 [Aethina tumida]|uniref:SH3 domain-binding protein 5 homolog isoform X2 n=1 Tax=Aethina tumida TaxID=116153 RepID=UPI00096B512C|nr:SH3 domain-binding protein 5 homolog isoform X2 [Aethina tumida]